MAELVCHLARDVVHNGVLGTLVTLLALSLVGEIQCLRVVTVCHAEHLQFLVIALVRLLILLSESLNDHHSNASRRRLARHDPTETFHVLVALGISVDKIDGLQLNWARDPHEILASILVVALHEVSATTAVNHVDDHLVGGSLRVGDVLSCDLLPILATSLVLLPLSLQWHHERRRGQNLLVDGPELFGNAQF